MISTCPTPDEKGTVEFRCNAFGYVTHRWSAEGAGWSDYVPVLIPQPGSFDSVEAFRNPDGRLEVLCWHSLFGAVFRAWQTSPGGAWHGWVAE